MKEIEEAAKINGNKIPKIKTAEVTNNKVIAFTPSKVKKLKCKESSVKKIKLKEMTNSRSEKLNLIMNYFEPTNKLKEGSGIVVNEVKDSEMLNYSTVSQRDVGVR